MTRADRFLAGYVPYLLRHADQTLSAPFYAALSDYGVARSEWRVLAVIHDLGEMTVVDLAEAALSPQPTVTNALRRLEKRGLLVRKAGTADKRQRFVSLTKAGRKLTAELISQARHLEAELLADAGDIEGLLDRLRALTASIEDRASQNSSLQALPIKDTA